MTDTKGTIQSMAEQKIYLITVGRYDYWDIHSAFLNEDAALDHAAKLNGITPEQQRTCQKLLGMPKNEERDRINASIPPETHRAFDDGYSVESRPLLDA